MCLGGTLASAADRTWTGSGPTTNWSQPANWVGGVAPVNGDRLFFNTAGFSSVNDLGSTKFESITVSNSHTFQGSAITLTGVMPLTIQSNPAFTVGVIFMTDLRIESPTATISVAGSGILIFETAGRLVTNGSLIFSIQTGRVTFYGGIVEQSPSTLTFQGREFDLYGTNAFTGVVDLQGGLLDVATSSGLGSPSAGTIVRSGVLSLYNQSTTTTMVIDEPIALYTNHQGPSPALLSFSYGPGVRFRGPIDIRDEQQLNAAGGAFLDGRITGSGRLNLVSTSSAIVISNPANSFSGIVDVYQGTTRFAASEVIADSSSLFVHQDGRLELGGFSETVRDFLCLGTLALDLGSGRIRVLQLTEFHHLDCALDLSIPAGLAPANEYTIIRNDSGAAFLGSFRSMPEGAQVSVNGRTMFLTYRGGSGVDVSLVATPQVARLEVVSGARQSLAFAEVAFPFVVRAFNAAGVPVAGTIVTFSAASSCGNFLGAATMTAGADTNGVATSVPFTAASVATTACNVVATAQGTAAPPLSIPTYVYSLADVTLMAVAPSIVVGVNQDFGVAVDLQAMSVRLPNLQVQFTVAPGSAVGPAMLAAGAATDDSGRARSAAAASNNVGGYSIVASFRGRSVTIPVTQILPANRSLSLQRPNGATAIGLALVSPSSTCSFTQSQFIDPVVALLPVMPTNVAFPEGLLSFRAENCGTAQAVNFIVTYPQVLPPTATYWKFGPTPGNSTPHWYALPATVEGNRLLFTIVDGGLGDDDLTANNSITDMGGLAFNGGALQDLWWSGTAENGWGMSIIQHGDVLFANVYVYDSAGKPMWLVIPGGGWNASHTAFTGALYIPHGSPYYAYDVSRFNVGTAVGTATFTFDGQNNAVFDYTINGVAGRKNLTRLAFGRPETVGATNIGDLWWGGQAQNGWGITVLQQLRTLFSLWFTYDADGAPTWYVMPGGEWTASDTYEGRIYRAVGARWVGATYDATQHRTIDVGSYRLRFTGDSATFDYTIDGRTGSLPLTRLAF